jgi:hypothetical protein
MRPFLYPQLTHAWKKIEKTIAAMGDRGTKVPEKVEDEETKKTARASSQDKTGIWDGRE